MRFRYLGIQVACFFLLQLGGSTVVAENATDTLRLLTLLRSMDTNQESTDEQTRPAISTTESVEGSCPMNGGQCRESWTAPLARLGGLFIMDKELQTYLTLRYANLLANEQIATVYFGLAEFCKTAKDEIDSPVLTIACALVEALQKRREEQIPFFETLWDSYLEEMKLNRKYYFCPNQACSDIQKVGEVEVMPTSQT